MVKSGRRLRLAHACQARADPGGYFLVDSFQERCHHRVAVLGPQLGAHRSGGPDFPGVTTASRSCGQRSSDDRAAIRPPVRAGRVSGLEADVFGDERAAKPEASTPGKGLVLLARLSALCRAMWTIRRCVRIWFGSSFIVAVGRFPGDCARRQAADGSGRDA